MAKAIPGPGTSATSSAVPPARGRPIRRAPCATCSSTNCWPTPTPPCSSFVELYNHSNQTNDLSGCILTDDPATPKFVIPQGTLIPPAGFLAFAQSQLGFVPSAAGGTLFLVSPDGSRALDAVQFEGQADGVSSGAGRTGRPSFIPWRPGPGTNNSAIRIGDIVINELMYDPISGNDDDQYLELYNRGANPVDLSGWQFTAGVSFTFPAGATLAPERLPGGGAQRDESAGQVSQPQRRQHAGQLRRRPLHKGERVSSIFIGVFC